MTLYSTCCCFCCDLKEASASLSVAGYREDTFPAFPFIPADYSAGTHKQRRRRDAPGRCPANDFCGTVLPVVQSRAVD